MKFVGGGWSSFRAEVLVQCFPKKPAGKFPVYGWTVFFSLNVNAAQSVCMQSFVFVVQVYGMQL